MVYSPINKAVLTYHSGVISVYDINGKELWGC